MATIRKSITFTDTLSNWMQSLVASGEYANESEYVRELVRKDREKNAKLLALREAIDEGLKSGVSPRSVTDILTAKEAQLRKDGRL
ncbi:MAG: type II toxin-antitoxin system ParD family antitoxin [Flavobacteriales bacterium]|nr:type II toxin-antitoxin system ParD family antitoxin [Flavobacteriales bacterium]